MNNKIIKKMIIQILINTYNMNEINIYNKQNKCK